MRVGTWNYDYTNGFKPNWSTVEQNEWNLTLIKEILKLSNHKGCTIIVPNKFKFLFFGFNSFNITDSVLLEMYSVEFVDSPHNNIYINLNAKLEILNYKE